jgi:hypothetical protein
MPGGEAAPAENDAEAPNAIDPMKAVCDSAKPGSVITGEPRPALLVKPAWPQRCSQAFEGTDWSAFRILTGAM